VWPSYNDIRSRLGEPLWWDGNCVPRYEPFHPDLCGVHNEEVALIEIACQQCDQRFLVAIEVSKRREDASIPTPETVWQWGFGDPPRHARAGGCAAGDVMQSIPMRIVEFWSRASGGTLERHQAGEVGAGDDRWAHVRNEPWRLERSEEKRDDSARRLLSEQLGIRPIEHEMFGPSRRHWSAEGKPLLPLPSEDPPESTSEP